MEEKPDIESKLKITEAFKQGISVDVDDKDLPELKELIVHKAKPSPEEFKKVKDHYSIEKGWWGEYPSYENMEDVNNAIEKGVLTRVTSNRDIKIRISVEKGLIEGSIPYLEKETALLLTEIGKQWREKMKHKSLPENIVLAVPSLLRTKEYQKKIVDEGVLALPESTHTKGFAFDVDGSGYYLYQEDGNTQSINARQSADYLNSYNKEVHEILREVLEEMKSGGLLNYIPEYENTDNQCFHIARNPEAIFSEKIEE